MLWYGFEFLPSPTDCLENHENSREGLAIGVGKKRNAGVSGMPVPKRGNLVAECVRVMKLRIAAGEWADALPGERALAETLRVGRDTIRLTLRSLESDGVLAPAAAGVRRRVLPVGVACGKAAEEILRIGFLAPKRLELLPQLTLLEIDQIREALAEKGGVLEVFSPTWYERAHPAAKLAEFIAEHRRTAWILYRSTAAVRAWFAQQHIPALVRGYPHGEIALPSIDVDWEAVARHAAGVLWRAGHRCVALLSPPDILGGVEAAARGVAGFQEDGFAASVLHEDGTAEGVGRVLGRALRLQHPPTAFIATRPRQVASALSWLVSRGIRVPDDVSLLSLGWEPFLDHLVPEISGYRIDPKAVAKLVVRRLERVSSGDGNSSGSPWITSEIVRGGSVASR